MPQQLSPWIEGAYGWNFGEGGWNTGMDSNLLKFSFLFDRNIDAVVSALPSAVSGQAYFLTTDNRLYFAVGTTWFSTPTPKWFIVKVKSTGQTHQFNGTSIVQIDTPIQLDARLDAVELSIASLGSAAFEDVAFFATSSQLDVAEANAANYTDAQVGIVSADVLDLETYNLKRECFRTIEEFGPIDTPANTLATMQAAINWCATNKVLLRNKASEYTIDVSTTSITIPDNFRCDLGNAWIKRATGNTTPQDMWINADTVSGNTGIHIQNVRFDGQRQADSLTNVTVAHRFCGLRLINCVAALDNVRVDNTVNAEVQAEGTRAAIMLFDSQLVICRNLFADGNAGTGFIAENGLVSVDGAWFYNNTGSGLSVRNCDGSYFNNCNNDTSGYSGLSFNAADLRISNMKSINSPVGYAGINIGHSSAASQAPNCVAVNLRVTNCLGWGIFVNFANNLSGANWTVDDSVTRGVHIVDSLNVRVTNLRSRNAAANDVLVTGASTVWLDVDFKGSQSSSVQTTGTASAEFSGTSIIEDPCQSATGTIAGVLANAGTRIRYTGAIVNSDRYGVVSSGAGAIVDLAGSRITGSAVGPTLAASGGVINYSNSKFSSTDHTSGTFTILSGTASIVTNNGNTIDANRIMVLPNNAAAQTAGQPRITISAGVSFTATLPANAAADATYSYVML